MNDRAQSALDVDLFCETRLHSVLYGRSDLKPPTSFYTSPRMTKRPLFVFVGNLSSGIWLKGQSNPTLLVAIQLDCKDRQDG